MGKGSVFSENQCNFGDKMLNSIKKDGGGWSSPSGILMGWRNLIFLHFEKNNNDKT